MHLTGVTVVLMSVLISLLLEHGYGSPLFDGSNSWLDKLPSIEVKVKTDGITVKTGPSREEIYTVVGYVIVGAILVVTVVILITICVYKYYCIRGSSHIIIQGGPEATATTNFLAPSNHHNGICVLPPMSNAPRNVSVGTHFIPKRNDASSFVTSEQLDMQPARGNTKKPVQSVLYRSTS